MSSLLEEMNECFGLGDAIKQKEFIDEMSSYLQHYGLDHLTSQVGPGSGRYRYGSGDNVFQHPKDFLDKINQLKAKGWTETPENIKNTFGLSVAEYRSEKTIANEDKKDAIFARVKQLQEEHPTWTATNIGKEMGVNESTVRGWQEQMAKGNELRARKLAESLKQRVDESSHGMVDVGKGEEINLNVSRTKLDTALYILEKEGYGIYSNRIPQPTNKNHQTTQTVLCSPSIKPPEGKQVPSEIYDYDKIDSLTQYISRDGGNTLEKKFHYPASLDSKRIKIRYAEDTDSYGVKGVEKDGVIELRPGVADLSLSGRNYAQVRILVDGTHYLKGMAVYGEPKEFPEGVDVIFNTNKKRGTPMMDPDKNNKQVLKNIKNDPDNPFGSTIKDADQGGQYWYTDKNGKRKLGLINKKSDESDWTEWTNALPSQFLSKQPKELAKKQLDLAKATKMDEFNTIMSLENPVVKKYYLKKFADGCDKAAVDLKAAALPGQKYHVLIPNNTLKKLKDGTYEIYAPGYSQGQKLALVRYPHEGIFEIPICTVNNKNTLGKRLIGERSIDAVCVPAKVASMLSGADFDGDTVMVIPATDKRGRIKISSAPEGKTAQMLKDFDTGMYAGERDPKTGKYYYNDKEYKPMDNRLKQVKMGEISNLITDMTFQGASPEELARATKHAMVVIDAEKHKLDYKQSYADNKIAELERAYQPKYDAAGNIIRAGGAATIISRAKGQVHIDKRKGQPKINIKGASYYDPTKPEGAYLWSKADDKDLYYAQSTYDKNTGIKKITTTDGKKITYNMYNEKERAKYNPVLHKNDKTGEVYYTNKDGSIKYKTVKRTIVSTKMLEADDAYDLVSNKNHPYPMEKIYADYANSMKALANKARVEYVLTKNLQYDPQAAKVYKNTVSGLVAKLNQAKKNAPIERAVLRKSNVEIKKKVDLDPELSSGDIRKLGQRSMTKYRSELGSLSRKERNIVINDDEWTAIQSGAVSNKLLEDILANANPDSLRERAMPKDQKTLTLTQQNRIKSMSNSDFTIKEIADKMGISTSAVSKVLKGEY